MSDVAELFGAEPAEPERVERFRRTKAMIEQARRDLWIEFTYGGYAGHGICPDCGAEAYLAGRAYDRKICRACHMDHGPSR